MSLRVSYGLRVGHLDGRRAGGRQIAQPPYSSLDEAIDAIKADIQAGEESLVPECTTSEVTLGLHAVLELHRPNIGPYSEGGEHDLPASFKDAWTDASEDDGGRTYPTATVDAITSIADKEARAVVQRAASRGIVAAVELADGFKYSINNAWASKDADGQRFSYICQDSMQNKDRHANGFTRTQKHLKTDAERGPRKPTYDCKGSVSIKCSMVRRTIDIFYRHYAIHSSVAERKSVQRLPRIRTLSSGDQDGGGQAVEQGGLLRRLQNEKSAFAPSPVSASASQGGSNIGRPLKRKRDEDTPTKTGKPLSLFELLKQSEARDKNSEVRTPTEPPQHTAMHPPPMNYDLPSWQAPPPRSRAAQKPHATQQIPHNAPPFQPAYQPQNAHAKAQPRTLPRQQPSVAPTAPQPATAATTYNETGMPPGYSTHNATPAQHHPQQPNNTPMFSTLKPNTREAPLTLYSGRTRSSCTNCRYAKKKCDETRPVCSSCAKVGRFDCAYDGPYGYPASAGQQAGMGGWVGVTSQVPVGAPEYVQQQYPYPSPTPAQVYGQVAPPPTMGEYSQAGPQQQSSAGAEEGREESPDPWFPKR